MAFLLKRCQYVLLLTGLRPTRRRRRNRCVLLLLLLLLCRSCCCWRSLVSECGEVFLGATKTSFVATKASAYSAASRAVLAASRAAFAVSADAYWFFDDVLSFRRPECFFFCIVVVAGFWLSSDEPLFSSSSSPLALASRDEPPSSPALKRSSFSFSILFSPGQGKRKLTLFSSRNSATQILPFALTSLSILSSFFSHAAIAAMDRLLTPHASLVFCVRGSPRTPFKLFPKFIASDGFQFH